MQGFYQGLLEQRDGKASKRRHCVRTIVGLSGRNDKEKKQL